jgi:hypothetical protein
MDDQSVHSRDGMTMSRTIAILALLLLCGLCSCSRKPVVKSVPSSLPANEAKALKESLAKLDQLLATRAKTIHGALAPPATSTEITTLRKGIDGSVVEALEIWYGWHNGTTDQQTSLLPLGRPLSIQEALDDKKLVQGRLFDGTPHKEMIKIMEDGSGDGYFLDITSKQPTALYSMLESPQPHFHCTLREFVEFIIAAYEKEILKDDPSQGTYDMDKYFALEREMLRK